MSDSAAAPAPAPARSSHDAPEPIAPFVPVIPAGGSGTRLWPLSRRDHPKFLLDLTGSGRSLLQATVDRLAPLSDRPPLVVTGRAHAPAVRAQVGESARVLAEPSPRNSMPAIALAAAVAHAADPDAVIGSFAADHLIAPQERFEQAVTAARRAAELGYLVTLGIEPTHPATGFGYIESGQPRDQEATDALRAAGAEPVVRFVEKPDRATAEEFLATGRFRWNGGMFVVRASVLLDALVEQIPPMEHGVRRIAEALGTPQEQEVLDEVWPTLTSIAIDHALAEPLAAQGRVATVPADFDWDDVGDFAALGRQLREARAARVGTDAAPGRADGDVISLGDAEIEAVGSRATVYGSTGRLVALVGLDGVSVVDTDDVLLVLADDAAQSLSGLVGGLEDHGRGSLR
ncbi:mannose-1-phosphate guanylyltransferase [Brachybacterium sp. EF45031]|uniref:mannose-1-phosphate guanylyltransferase n=1 Tax=Brachybacterium sillae TaxID=2810536 RepID=UPI00217D7F03|nr:mannose-1-phosphate guanylyltransferase [Brachybacterium sillae]MCS6711071.1 mannose-1-phosphate guanylyltransferase [Brachybacterium sillae]